MRYFPGKKKKAVTFSYDDGILQDKRFVEILNKYKLKATFNLNYGLLGGGQWEDRGHIIRRIDNHVVNDLYGGHEIACHSLTHPSLVELDEDRLDKELGLDRKGLEDLTGRVIKGMAYPFGTYNDLVIKNMKKNGIVYGRTVEDTRNFGLPVDFYRWHPTCHHNDKNIFSIIDDFLNKDSDDLDLLYIWGHSYEFDLDDNWDHFEKIAEALSGHDSVWYATNMAIYDYMNQID
ncbi:polysaccharide deacetylase [Acidaminobacter sp. JC074]|uniref:polysaccharide deacetylase family protein n=1 Tax=Acidaminobacter sp. JC074 TaxID=2530199 RepID=UPI001F10187F|nr:polysaccharide deacetylase family protein [Acidaminobacter sp. JC074]MCH4888421.1 polysaccharide deacetylase [Acidaminobacter sp. JC074]